MMMVENLSRNNLILLEEISKNKRLAKLIYYPDVDCLSKADVTFKQLFDIQNKKNVLSPLPFPTDVPEFEGCELRVWFYNGRIEKRAFLDTRVLFQFVLNNNKSLILDENGVLAIRHYEVIKEIVNTFPDNKTIDTLGIIKINGYGWIETRSKDYTLYQVGAEMMSVGRG